MTGPLTGQIMSPVPTPLPEDPLMTPVSALLSASSWFSCCSSSARLFSTVESVLFFCLRIASDGRLLRGLGGAQGGQLIALRLEIVDGRVDAALLLGDRLLLARDDVSRVVSRPPTRSLLPPMRSRTTFMRLTRSSKLVEASTTSTYVRSSVL